MNIELDEVVVQDVSDDALELAAGGAQGGYPSPAFSWCGCYVAIADSKPTPTWAWFLNLGVCYEH